MHCRTIHSILLNFVQCRPSDGIDIPYIEDLYEESGYTAKNKVAIRGVRVLNLSCAHGWGPSLLYLMLWKVLEETTPSPAFTYLDASLECFGMASIQEPTLAWARKPITDRLYVARVEN